MTTTRWTNTRTGQPLSWPELEQMRRHARRVYEVNSHIFEDEVDALTALGVVPLWAVWAYEGLPLAPTLPAA